MAGSDDTFYLGRQAIYDRDLEVRAYEILYRDGRGNRARVSPEEGDQASARVIADLFLELGIEAVTESRPAFVNLTRRLLFSDLEELFPPAHFWLEVLEDVTPDADMGRRLGELRAAGYRIVLDDFRYSPAHEVLLAHADVVKLDIMDFPDDATLDRELAAIRRPGLRLLAEKIESPEQFERCLDRDFELFQGYVLAEPVVLEGRRVAVPRRRLLDLLARVNDPETDWATIVELVQGEVGLAYRVMRFLGMDATAGEDSPDLEVALTRLGRRRLRAWINLSLLSEVVPSGDDLRRRALVRALMAEELARRTGRADPSLMFLGGLFSGLASALGRSAPDLYAGVSLRPELRAALETGAGPAGALLRAVLDYLRGDVAALREGGVPIDELRAAWLHALESSR